MKQQWLLLLAMVGMSLGALADCDPYDDPCSCCYGYDSSGNEQSKSIDNYGCTVSDLYISCWETLSAASPSTLVSCGTSYVTYDKCYGNDNCYWCKNTYGTNDSDDPDEE